MKKYIIICLFAICGISTAYAGSWSCQIQNAARLPSEYSSIANGNGLADTCASTTMQYFCSSVTKTCEAVTVCASCPSGYTLKSKTITDVSLLQICNASITIPYCCKNCSSCTSDTSWTIDVFKGTGYPGYDRMYERTCNCDGTCAATAKYRCSDGYCGVASFSQASGPSGCSLPPENGYCISGGGYGCNAGYYGSSVCTRCPLVPDTYYDDSQTQPVYGTTVTSNNMVINACFLAAGDYYDEHGNKFRILDTGTCYY